jgi:hypothetical protein
MPVSAGVRHGIVPLTSPRLAAENAANAEPRASKNAVSFHGLKKVLRTGRSEAAARTWAANEMNDGRDETLITTNEKTDDQLHGAEAAGFKSSPIRRARRVQSSINSENSASGDRQRAMVTNFIPGTICARFSRMISRICRRRRLRATALPSFFPVIRPKRKSAMASSRRRASTKYRPDRLRPCALITAKSRDSFKRRREGRRMSGVNAVIPRD